MRRETQNIVLGLLGGALLKISVDGTFLRYVKPETRPWLISAGVIMLGLACVAIVRDIRTANAHSASSDHDDHHHGGRLTWLLALPVFTVFLIAPPALGADSVLRAATLSPLGSQPVVKTTFPPLAQGDPLPMRLTDVVTRSAWDATNALAGRSIRVTGFLVHQGDNTYLARLVITCCAADAMPVKIRLPDNVSGFPDDQWLTVTGQVQPGSAARADDYVPAMTVATVQPVQAPADPYE